MTITQLNAFALVARLGSVTAAASALGVSEPAVSQALAALRQHLSDPLLVRGPGGMSLTPGGTRLLGIATQMVALAAEAEAAVRQARGAPEQLRVIATSAIAEFVAAPLLEAFSRRYADALEVSTGVAAAGELAVLVENRLADAALGPNVAKQPYRDLVSEPVFRYKIIYVTGRRASGGGPVPPDRATWLVDPSGAEPDSDVSRLLHRLGVAEGRIRVFANQTAALAAAADGAGIAPAPAHLVAHQLQRGELCLADVRLPPVQASWHLTMPARERRHSAAAALRNFLATPEAMRLMRKPDAGVRPSRFRPPVYVTIWS
jgi:DNA-binding transcriptional LysR family regulator